MDSYDQWKTASPYDAEPDPIEEAEKWLNRHAPGEPWIPGSGMSDARTIIEKLLAYIEEEI